MIIVHCPVCGAALSVMPRVTKATVSRYFETITIEFKDAQVDHACPEGEAA